MQIDIFTLFPEWFEWFRSQRHIKNACAAGHELRTLNPRDTTPLTHNQVDDAPYGGGPGMVLRVDVVDAALRATYGEDHQQTLSERRVAILTPSGRVLNEELVQELSECERITLIASRYEGYDERIREHLCNDAISIGRFVLSGGELATMVVVDAVMRRLPGALGDEKSVIEESFSEALGGSLEYPHFTRPASYRGWDVPEELLSGDHELVRKWRHQRVSRGGQA